MKKFIFDPDKLRKELSDRGYTMASASRAMGYSSSGLKGACAKGEMTESMAASLDAIVGLKIDECPVTFSRIPLEDISGQGLFDGMNVVNLPSCDIAKSDDDFAGWLYEQIFRAVYNAMTAWDQDRRKGGRQEK